MASIIEAKNLSKRYGSFVALDDVSFSVQPGRIVGLIGRNGAGKTTALKTILGLTTYQGSVQVLGVEPARDRNALMSQVCFIADAAVLPRWLSVAHAIDYVAGVHPRFDRKRAEQVLAATDIRRGSRIGQLSKGMITQLHLALILAINARLLVLDEPTLGLDLVYRRQFYDTLLNDYIDKERTILLTTHQVEEVENLLTDVLFIDRGRVVLDAAVDDLPARFQQLTVAPDRTEEARALNPFYVRELFGRTIMLYENLPADQLAGLGELRTPGIADLFMAKMQGAASQVASSQGASSQGATP